MEDLQSQRSTSMDWLSKFSGGVGVGVGGSGCVHTAVLKSSDGADFSLKV